MPTEQQKKLDTLYQANWTLFNQAGIPYQEWQHEDILDFTTDTIVAERLGWTAAPTKSLFLKIKGGGYCLLLTHRDNRLNSKQIKQAIGKRVSVCSDEEMIEQIHCVPGAVCPFALPQHITLLVDPDIYNYQEIMFTPGKPDHTFAFATEQLPLLLGQLNNPVVLLTPDKSESITTL